MSIKNLLQNTPPRVLARAVSLFVALALALTGARIAYLVDVKNPPSYAQGEQNTETGKESDENGEEAEVFSSENAQKVGSVIGAKSGALCSLTDSLVLAEKEMHGAVSIKDATVFMTALTAARAVSEGRVMLSDEAVCPASAAKKPNYNLSSQVLPIGKKMTLEKILKCMLYQSGSSYAYTLAVHISGSEEAFVSEMNEYASALGVKNTSFNSCTGDESDSGTVSAYDLAVIMKAFLSDTLLGGIFCSNEMITVSGTQSTSVKLVVENDFFASYCTESQAKNDGILGGKVGISYFTWSCVLFKNGGKSYISVVLDSNDAFTDALMLYSAYAPAASS